jgi:glutathione S-transferase
MKLYFSPGACSLSPHIVLHEAGLACEIEKVNLKTRKTASGEDFLKINPKGYVPALQLDDGNVLTEGPAIVQYLADQAPSSGLAPSFGAIERYRLMEWLNFISTELHKSFSPMFKPGTSEDAKQAAREAIMQRLNWLDEQLRQREYLMGVGFTVADAYLFTVLGWTRFVQIDLAPWPAVQAYSQRIGDRPAVKAAMRAEGLLKE